jgi:hypothetical protein
MMQHSHPYFTALETVTCPACKADVVPSDLTIETTHRPAPFATTSKVVGCAHCCCPACGEGGTAGDLCAECAADRAAADAADGDLDELLAHAPIVPFAAWAEALDAALASDLEALAG